MHIPADVVSARHFDSWWKTACKESPELLNFEREMLLQAMLHTSMNMITPTNGCKVAS